MKQWSIGGRLTRLSERHGRRVQVEVWPRPAWFVHAVLDNGKTRTLGCSVKSLRHAIRDAEKEPLPNSPEDIADKAEKAFSLLREMSQYTGASGFEKRWARRARDILTLRADEIDAE